MSDCGETVESVVGQAFLPVEPFNPGRRERLPYNSGDRMGATGLFKTHWTKKSLVTKRSTTTETDSLSLPEPAAVHSYF